MGNSTRKSSGDFVVKTLADVREEIGALRRELERLDQIRKTLALLEATESVLSGASPVPVNTLTTSQSALPPRLSDALEQLLRDKGPRSAPALADELLARGYPGRGGDTEDEQRRRLREAIYGTLKKNPKRFRRVGSGLWDFIKQEVTPEAQA